jgi:hypothetical protein
MAERLYTTPEAARLAGTAAVTAQKWAAINEIDYIGTGLRKTFIWRTADIERFKNRNTARGRPRAD